MAALILPGQYASWQNGLIHAVWQGRELSEFACVNGFSKIVTPGGDAIRLTGTQYLRRMLPAGFNFPLTFVSVFRRTVSSSSRVLASVGSGTQRHLLYFQSSSAVAIYSAAGGATGQAVGAGISDLTKVHFAVGRVSSAAYRDVFVDGVFYSPNTATVSTTPQNVHAIGAYWNNDAAAGTFYSDADILFSGLWNRALSNAEILDLHKSWERIKRPSASRIWVPASTGGSVGNASGSLSSITTAAASAVASGAAQSAAAFASLSFTPAEASASGGVSVVGNASASLASLSLSAASASASGLAAASSALAGISVAPASAVASGGASVPATASASLASLSTAPATATASGAATAAGAMLGMNLTPAQAQATAAAWAAAELRALSVTPATATAGDGSAAPWPAGRADSQHLAVVPFAGVRAAVPFTGVRAAVPFTGARAIVQQDTP